VVLLVNNVLKEVIQMPVEFGLLIYL